MSSDVLIAILTAIVWLLCVGWPTIALVRRIALPDEREWQRIKEHIKNLHRDLVDDADYSETTKQALKLVLTREPGYSRAGYLSLALDVIQAPADYIARTAKALSAQSIVVGLCGTVVTFAALFSRELAVAHANAATAQNLAASVVEHLRLIYLINAFAIGVALVLYHVGWWAKHRGERACFAASAAFAETIEGTDASLAPELAAALDRSAAEFRRFSETLFTDQFSKIERLLGQVKVLGDGIKELVKETVAQNKRDEGVLQAQLRENSTAIERITQRLDEGFKLLAQPFIQGIPAMETVTEAAGQLKEAVDKFAAADITSAMRQMASAAAVFEHATTELPSTMSAAIEGSGAAIKDATCVSIETALRSALVAASDDRRRFLEAMHEQQTAEVENLKRFLTNMTVRLQRNSTIAASKMVTAFERFPSQLESSLEPVRAAIAAQNTVVERMHSSIDATVASATASLGSSVATHVGKASDAIVSELRASQTQRSANWATEAREAAATNGIPADRFVVASEAES
jgi:hypothetical protein